MESLRSPALLEPPGIAGAAPMSHISERTGWRARMLTRDAREATSGER